ncbi:stromelysin-1-like [Antedon mediterranea]|uniref:stromelysin-1-like n=1 Tax=Antedon mediterranea TaxID=105859 RepID=UPI003AF6E11E
MKSACLIMGILGCLICYSRSQEELTLGVDFMKQYGYLNPHGNAEDLMTKEEFSEAVKNMQLFNGLPPTGELDAATLELIKMPRCGVPDPVDSPNNGSVLGGRLKRYAHTGGRWEKTHLTYRIVNVSPDLPANDQYDAIRRSFKIWSDITPLTFEELTENKLADIMMSFGSYNHGDLYPFDGPGGTLAHAYPPQDGFGDLDGDVHFDDSEFYTVNNVRGINLLQVAAHEIGHSLGLAHSSDVNALMAPFYRGYVPNFRLPSDDITGIQSLYGSKPTGGGKPKPQPTYSTGNPLTCNKAFSAIGYIRGEIFAFKEDKYWRLRKPNELISSDEGDISRQFWRYLPKRVDAVYERYHDSMIIFLKGGKYWEYYGLTKHSGPNKLSKLGLPLHIDAAVSWGYYGKTYFFKGSRVWRFDEVEKKVDSGFPAQIKEVFKGVPDDIDAAFQYNDGYTYFIKGRQYYRYDNKRERVDNGFPRIFGVDFFACRTEQYAENGTMYNADGTLYMLNTTGIYPDNAANIAYNVPTLLFTIVLSIFLIFL